MENQTIPDEQEEELEQAEDLDGITEGAETEDMGSPAYGNGPAGGIFETTMPADHGSSYVAEQTNQYPFGNHTPDDQNSRR